MQYFFNVDVYFCFVDDVCKFGVDVLIVLGIMLIMNFLQLMCFFEMCGVEVLCWVVCWFESFGDDCELICVFGVDVVMSLCQCLIDVGVLGLYFYMLNVVIVMWMICEWFVV